MRRGEEDEVIKDKKVQDVQIAYIGGGSRGWAWTFMTDLALEPDMSGTIRLYDIDREAAEANESDRQCGQCKRGCKRKVGNTGPAPPWEKHSQELILQ